MIWHHDELIDLHRSVESGNLIPDRAGHLSSRRETHLTIDDPPEEAGPAPGTERDEVCIFSRVVVVTEAETVP